MRSKALGLLFSVSLIMGAAAESITAQENPPTPQAPKSAVIPAVRESKLANGLTIATVERKGVPLVTVQLLVRAGASTEDSGERCRRHLPPIPDT